MTIIVPSTTVTTGIIIGNADVDNYDLIWIANSFSM